MASVGFNEFSLPDFDFKGTTVVLVKTHWNKEIVDELENGARLVFAQYGVTHVQVITVPGAVEIPFAIQQHAKNSTQVVSAYIALGCVIKGGTPHFEYVCQSVTHGITQLNLQLDIPVIFGVLTLLNDTQAWERLGGPHGHKGREAAETALYMVALKKSL